MNTCKYCTCETARPDNICEDCWQGGIHRYWWIEPIAIVAMITAMFLAVWIT